MFVLRFFIIRAYICWYPKRIICIAIESVNKHHGIHKRSQGCQILIVIVPVLITVHTSRIRLNRQNFCIPKMIKYICLCTILRIVISLENIFNIERYIAKRVNTIPYSGKGIVALTITFEKFVPYLVPAGHAVIIGIRIFSVRILPVWIQPAVQHNITVTCRKQYGRDIFGNIFFLINMLVNFLHKIKGCRMLNAPSVVDQSLLISRQRI